VAIYDFHHSDPNKKETTIGSSRAFESMKKELDKCALICANCHRKLHYYEDR